MLKSDILSKVQRHLDNLELSLQSTTKTGILNEITKRIGSLSAPSKMPGYAWSISAKRCITGAKLAKIAGTPCSKCYALRGRYKFDNVFDAQEVRYNGWKNDPDWIWLMVIRLILLNQEYFRWFDAGDLQSAHMLANICVIAANTPDTKHWLPTQERKFVNEMKHLITSNLTVRISSTKINPIYRAGYMLSSGVATNKEIALKQYGHICPSHEQSNECGDCRACWDKTKQNIIYLEH